MDPVMNITKTAMLSMRRSADTQIVIKMILALRRDLERRYAVMMRSWMERTKPRPETKSVAARKLTVAAGIGHGGGGSGEG